MLDIERLVQRYLACMYYDHAKHCISVEGIGYYMLTVLEMSQHVTSSFVSNVALCCKGLVT